MARTAPFHGVNRGSIPLGAAFMEHSNNSITASHEAKFLNYAVKRVPIWVGPDFLTFLGLIASLGAGVSYIFSPKANFLLLGANVFILIHWISDSLDGRLAKIRKKYRPKYGFYIDHIFDSISAVLILGGLLISPLTNSMSWGVVLVVVLLAFINTFLKITAFGIFTLSTMRMGPTEARISLIVFNFFIFFTGNPNIFILSGFHSLADLGGWIIAGIITLVLIFDIAKSIWILSKRDLAT